jgi:WD40 repeat protein
MNVKPISILAILLTICFFAPIKAQSPKTNISFRQLQTITPDNAATIRLLVPTKWETKGIVTSPNGEMVAIATQIADYDFNVSILDTTTDKEISSMQGRMDSYIDLVWSPDNKRIAIISGRLTGGGVEEQTVKTYTIEKGKNPAFYRDGNRDAWYYNYVNSSLDRPINPPRVKVAWSSASDLLAISFYGKLEVYDGENDKALFSTPVTDIVDISWSPNGKFIVAKTTPNNVSIWGVQ